MDKEATQQGAEPQKTKAFPDPKIPEGVDTGVKNDDDTPVKLTPRDAMLAEMDARIDEQRTSEIQNYQTELAEASGLEAPKEPVDEPEAGLASQEPAGEESDPLADYIVMVDNKPMLKNKIDGEEKLVPLQDAQAQLQKQIAGDIRLQQAARRNKELDEREEQIRQNEAALAQKLKEAQASPPSDPPDLDVSDQDLDNEVRQVVEGLFSGTEDQAVEHLTNLVRKTRQAETPRIDPKEVAEQAVAAARQELEAENARKAAAELERAQVKAFKDFEIEFKDVLADEKLFRYADSLTEDLGLEHPDWTPHQIMTEAGKQTREWVESLKTPTSEQEPQPSDREVQKQNLTPMPQAHTGSPPKEEPEPEQTPGSYLDDLRKSRGQA